MPTATERAPRTDDRLHRNYLLVDPYGETRVVTLPFAPVGGDLTIPVPLPHISSVSVPGLSSEDHPTDRRVHACELFYTFTVTATRDQYSRHICRLTKVEWRPGRAVWEG